MSAANVCFGNNCSGYIWLICTVWHCWNVKKKSDRSVSNRQPTPGDTDEISSTHCNGVIMSTMASQITSLTSIHSIVYSGADQRKHQSSASLPFVSGIQWWPVNSPHKRPVTRKMFPSDDVIMISVLVIKINDSRWNIHLHVLWPYGVLLEEIHVQMS